MTLKKTLTALAAAAGLCLTAYATTVLPVNLAFLVEHAEKAFVGTVDSVERVQIGNIWTDQVTVTVTEGVIGCSAGESVTWNQVRNGENIPLPSMPDFTAGGQYLVFLSAHSGDSPFTAPVALDQGAFAVAENEAGQQVAVNGTGNSTLYDGLNADAIHAAAPASADSPLAGLISDARALDAVANPQQAFAAPSEDGVVTATVQPSAP